MGQVYPAIPSVPGTTVVGPLTAFGDVATAQATPTGATDFIFGFFPGQTFQRQFAGGTASTVNGEVVLTTGTTTGGMGRCAMMPAVTYHPGQGTRVLGTCRFDPAPQANTRQLFGVSSLSSYYMFGYVGTQFGILHGTQGVVEVQTLTVTGAPAAPGNVVVTLDGGPAVNVAVTASGNTSVTAYEISQGNYASASGGWTAVSSNNVVYFTRRIPGPAGASTFAANGTGTVATIAILTAGVAVNETFIPQGSWNRDVLNGNGPSGMLADWSKGNVFQTRYQYLGYGNAFFYVEDSKTGQFQLVHVIQNANSRTTPVLTNPNGYLLWEASNEGSATGVTLRGASCAAFLEGAENYFGQERAVSTTRSILATTETPVLSVRPINVLNNLYSTRQMFPLRLSVATDGTKSVVFNVYKNAALTAAQFMPVAVGSCALKDSSATSIVTTNATLVYSFVVSKVAQDTQNLHEFNTFLAIGETLSVTAYSANGSDVSVAFAWDED